MTNQTEDNKSNKIFKILETTASILKKNSVEYYLDMTTLQRVASGHTSLPDNETIYLSLLNENDFYKIYEIASRIRKMGYSVSINTFYNIKNNFDNDFFTDPYNLQTITVGRKLKIIFKYKNNKQLNWIVKKNRYAVPDEILLSGFDEVDFYNVKCKIPKNYDEYLNSLYGDWRNSKLPLKKSLKSCTLKNKIDKLIRTGTHEGKRFKYQCNKIYALELLKTTINALDKHEVEYHLDFGTLIGAMREKEFIEWDDDIDISLFREEDYYKMQEVMKEIQNKGLSVSRVTFATSIQNRKEKAEKDSSIEVYVNDIDFTDKYNTRVFKVRHYNKAERVINYILGKFGHRKRAGKYLDIFVKYKKDNKIVWMAQHKIHHIAADNLSKELVEIDFYNLKCKIPKNYDEYLTSMYGDWKTPKKDWQYYEEDTVTRK